MVKALDLRSNGRVVRVGSNPSPGTFVNVNIKLSMTDLHLERYVEEEKRA